MVDTVDTTEKTEKNIEALSAALESGTLHTARGMLNALHPAEIANLLESLPPRERTLIWELVAKESEGEVLINVGEELRNHLIKDMSPDQLVTLAEGLEVDDSADFIQSLPDTRYQPGFCIPSIASIVNALNQYCHFQRIAPVV